MEASPPAPPPPEQRLPQELLLQIAARSGDAVTFLRWAATCKPLRRAIVNGSRRFYPSSLLAVSYAPRHCDGGDGEGDDLVYPSRGLRFDAGILRSFEPVSSRDGLLVLWRHAVEDEPELRVCDTSTGHVTAFPCMDVEQRKWGNGGIYRPAMLAGAVAGAGLSFEMLVVDVCLRARTFSSEDGRWGAIRFVKPPPEHSSWCVIEQDTDTSPAVIGRTAHWICSSTRQPVIPGAAKFILALHADEAQSTSIELPRGFYGDTESCALAAAEDGKKLSVVVAETEAISTWTLSSPEEGWSRQVVVGKRRIGMQVTPGVDASRTIRFVGVGERGGTVLFWMVGVGLLQLDQGTRRPRAVLLRRCGGRGTTAVKWACLHDVDLASLLQDMKPF